MTQKFETFGQYFRKCIELRYYVLYHILLWTKGSNEMMMIIIFCTPLLSKFFLSLCLHLSVVFYVSLSGRYCKGFAAGVYCVDCCACTECFNKPEYEEIVLDTRHQIQSRNPLAFVQRLSSLLLTLQQIKWKVGTGRHHPQPGTKGAAIARSQIALKNIVNVSRYMLMFVPSSMLYQKLQSLFQSSLH
ncbi:uncharacterized protein LOC120011243 [Tripterygium wilfordii]|uniref:uncharacterized protein LOC120011243 n=1 Tax=Tripterygium wilfordii TaxID=458696 RepID=UPI0018F7EBF3|nr:uncharacterized protein LOC120011243 [Tripterygium wilfordii]